MSGDGTDPFKGCLVGLLLGVIFIALIVVAAVLA